MKDLFLWILVAFIALCGCVISYRYGLTTGQAACPIKYAICENGTCVLSDTAPVYPGQ
jgi:hypothetical protein